MQRNGGLLPISIAGRGPGNGKQRVGQLLADFASAFIQENRLLSLTLVVPAQRTPVGERGLFLKSSRSTFQLTL